MNLDIEALFRFLAAMEQRILAATQKSITAGISGASASATGQKAAQVAVDGLQARISGLEAEMRALKLAMSRPSAAGRLLLVTPFYPGNAKDFGGEFIHSRVKVYQDCGIDIHVFEVSGKSATFTEGVHDGVMVYRGGVGALDAFLQDRNGWHASCLIHFVQSEMMPVLLKHFDENKLVIWVHGYEARDYRRLIFNFTAEYLEKNQHILEAVTVQRMDLLRVLLPNPAITKVFVSNFCRDVAETDSGAKTENYHIIHNVIDEEVFQYRRKTASDRYKLLLIRAFTARNYANDIAIDALRLISTDPVFKRLEVHVQGFGPMFKELTAPLLEFPNIKCVEAHASQDEIAELHSRHGVMLVPSRFDTQGVTLGEAMSSGLVPVTNAVAAIPEFVDDTCAVVCEPDSAEVYAQDLLALLADSKRYLRLSAAAAARSRAQCGREHTVQREVALLQQRLKRK
jgi:glycosyltransferase involved in cell wall biosynthesis